jgi:hypothetical protein
MRWGPFNQDPKRVRVVVPDVVCGQSYNCAGESCPYYKCMGKIEVDDVVDIAIELLKPEDNQ